MNDLQMQPEAREDSLAPVQLDRLTVEEEVALIKSGKLRKLALATMLTALVGTGAAFWMKGIDTREAYANAAASARKLRNDELEAFARCALPQTPPAQFDSKSALLNALESYGDRYGKDYGRTLARCNPLLEGLPADVAGLKAPAKLAPRVQALSQAASTLERAVADYRTHLTGTTRYDYVQALPLMDKLASAWNAYEARQAELDAAASRGAS